MILALKSKTSPQIDKEAWENEFQSKKYESIWSVAEDQELIAALAQHLKKSTKRILIPGCGSRTELQQYIINNFQKIEEIVCNDFSESAINLAKSNFSHPKLKYEIRDTSDLTVYESNYFDVVIVVNSILSGNHELNVKQLQEIYRVMRGGGLFVGLFPTTLCGFEIFYHLLKENFKDWNDSKWVDIENNCYFDSLQGIWKAGYTPNRLNHIIKEIGFKRERMEIFFCDSDYFKKESERVYGIPNNSGVYIWELLAILRK